MKRIIAKELPKEVCAMLAVNYNRIAHIKNKEPFQGPRMEELKRQWNQNCRERFGDIEHARFD